MMRVGHAGTFSPLVNLTPCWLKPLGTTPRCACAIPVLNCAIERKFVTVPVLKGPLICVPPGDEWAKVSCNDNKPY